MSGKTQLNRSMLQAFLKEGAGGCDVSTGMVDWCCDVAIAITQRAVVMATRGPNGKLMPPALPAIDAATSAFMPLVKEQEIQPAATCGAGLSSASQAEWKIYHDWQYARRTNSTPLSYEQWLLAGKADKETQAETH